MVSVLVAPAILTASTGLIPGSLPLLGLPEERAGLIVAASILLGLAGRQHFPFPVGAPLSEFETIAERYPVYRIDRA